MRPSTDVRHAAAVVDGDLAKKVQLFLSANHRGFRQVIVRAEGETVRLAGAVDSFYLRQTAVTLVKRLAGVRRVVDDLEVVQEEIGAREG